MVVKLGLSHSGKSTDCQGQTATGGGGRRPTKTTMRNFTRRSRPSPRQAFVRSSNKDGVDGREVYHSWDSQVRKSSGRKLKEINHLEDRRNWDGMNKLDLKKKQDGRNADLMYKILWVSRLADQLSCSPKIPLCGGNYVWLIVPVFHGHMPLFPDFDTHMCCHTRATTSVLVMFT